LANLSTYFLRIEALNLLSKIMIILEGVTMNELLEKIESIIEKKLEIQKKKLASEIVPNNRYLTRREVCELLRISPPTLHDWIKLGIIKSYKIGNRVLYKERQIDESLTHRKYKHYN
jgi:excisionase family DNA binding protein